MSIISVTDSLTLARIKQHLRLDDDFTLDDTLVEAYSKASLHYVEQYTGKSWAVWNLSEDFADFENPMFLNWNQEVRTANINYDSTLGGTVDLTVTVYADNDIREDTPADYAGGVLTITYSPYVDEHQKFIAEQARLLMIGDSYTHREDTITGTQVGKLPNGVLPLLDIIKRGTL